MDSVSDPNRPLVLPLGTANQRICHHCGWLIEGKTFHTGPDFELSFHERCLPWSTRRVPLPGTGGDTGEGGGQGCPRSQPPALAYTPDEVMRKLDEMRTRFRELNEHCAAAVRNIERLYSQTATRLASVTEVGDLQAQVNAQGERLAALEQLAVRQLARDQAWEDGGIPADSPGGARAASGPCTRGAGPPSAGSAAAPQDKSESGGRGGKAQGARRKEAKK